MTTHARPLRRRRWATAAGFILATSVTAPARGQDSTPPRRPGGAAAEPLPLQTTRTVAFTTTEGTWMSLDVSPDGATIIFDLLGDIYAMPIAGGKATRLTSGPPMDAQPRYSPDGKHIVFTSDRSGGEQVWTMDADGRNARAITRGDNGHYVSPIWTPDGNYVVVGRNVSQTAAFGDAYDLYLYHAQGGTGIRLTPAPAAGGGAGAGGGGGGGGIMNYIRPAFGKDGRYLYLTRKAGGWGYNLQFPGWQVAVLDRRTGRMTSSTSAFGSGMRPALSPDGKWMTYATRVDTTTVMRIRDLATGDESTLIPRLQRDDQESRFSRDVLPGYAFTPDSRAIVFSRDGKFWRAEVPSGRETPIPFSADVEQQLGPLVRAEVAVNDTALTVQQIRSARPSPDGKRLVFTALDRLWVMDLPNGKPRRLTKTNVGEFDPTWSADGRFIAYVTWSDEVGGEVLRVRSDGITAPERLTRQTAFYQKLTYSPDGTKLITIRSPRQARMEEQRGAGEELVWLPAAGGATTLIAPVTGAHDPHFVEGSLDLKMNITELLDGYPGHEHTYPIYPVFNDVVQLVAKSGITYTPTLLVVYGGPWSENYWYEHSDIHDDPKVRRFMPHYDVDQRSLRRPQWFRDDQYVFRQFAEQAKKILDAGGRVGLGGHGQMQGLGVHWELWSLAAGGMTPLDVIRVGTLLGAEGIGLGKELGSLEPGKLADLQVLDGNPLADIKNTNTIRYVMKNGRLYDGNTLAEIWPRAKPAEQPWWLPGR